MDVIRFLLLLTISISATASNNALTEYNDALKSYEQKIIECNSIKEEDFQDNGNLSIPKESIRIALSYFFVRAEYKCTETESIRLANSIMDIQADNDIAELLRSNAKQTLKLLKDNEHRIQKDRQRFEELDSENQNKLKKIEAYKRPFDPLKALNHYLSVEN